MASRKRRPLSALENLVMEVVWQRQQATAEDVRLALAGDRALKDSTVRTVLRRLEEKGYVRHTSQGRTYVYSPKVDALRAAADAVRGIIDRFCQGSVETLLVGMVDGEIVPAEKLRALAEKIAQAETAASPKGADAARRKSQSKSKGVAPQAAKTKTKRESLP